MKTTLDLPDHLMQQLKQRALQQGRPINELVADTIRQGLHGTPGAPLQPSARVVEVDAGGMPLFRTDPGFSGPPINLATALQLEQDALMQEDFFLDGPGVSDDFLVERADQEQAEREAF
jgi:hypothetical protein